MKKKLNVALIGYGFMGRAHSNAYRKVNQFFDLDYEPVMKVVCGRKRDEIEPFANRWGWQEVETDWKNLITRKDIDIVDICSPNNTHYEIAMAAVEVGKMIACEKPLAMSASETQKMAKQWQTLVFKS